MTVPLECQNSFEHNTPSNSYAVISEMQPSSAATRFRGMILKRIVKENHGRPINRLVFNRDHPGIFATCGGGQINIYDNESVPNVYDQSNDESSHIDIMLHWNGFSSNQNADLVREESLRNPIYSCAWLSVDFEDCILAFGGRHGTIHLVSVALSSEIYKLNNENKEAVTFLSAASQKCGVFCSLSQSSGMARVWRLWARDSVTLQSSHKFHQPTTAEFIISNNTCKGNWDLLIGCEDGHFYEVSNGITEKLLKRKHRKSIDSIKQLSTGYIISKSVDGEVLLWDCFKDELIKVLIKPRMTSFVAETLSPLEVNFEGTFFCFGDEDGKVLVYDVQGKLISKLKHPKVKKMRITTCAFTNQSNQILCATEKSFIFRFDYISPEVRAIWDKFEDSVENDEENTEGSS